MALDPRNINSKVTLKVKEGPGDIIGINELESINGVVDFTGIQFSDPGEYIISVIPSSPNLKPTEFSIKILPEEDVIPQEESKEDEPQIEGNRPIIAQIDQPTIKLEPMKFDATDSNEENKNIGIGLGFTPFFWYNGVQVPDRDIRSLELYYEDYIPKAKITFKDTFGLVKSPETRALNDTKFEIFLNSGSDILKSIHLKFKLEIQQDNKKGTVTITGIIDLKDFYKIGYKSYTGTSFEVLRKLSNELELGFNSNITNTNDSMKWRRNGILTKDFIREIIKHSYISDESFMIGYIDYYWCFNYVDIEKEWKRDISNDVAVVSTGVQHLSEGAEASKIVPLELTNDPSNNSSPFYFTNYRLNNNSTYQTTQKGTFTESKVYDRIKKQFLKFNIDSQTSDGDDKIILKGSPGDKSDLETNYRTNYSGKIDTDNVHENYLYAIDQNRRNLDELVKISIDMELPQPNFNLYKYQKVRLNFINQKQTVTDNKIIDERLSGEWIIIDIRYTWSNGGLSQRVTAVRKELGKTKEEIESQDLAPQKDVNNSEINDNPEIPNNSDNLNEDEFIFIDFDEDLLLIDDEFRESNFEGEDEQIDYLLNSELGESDGEESGTGFDNTETKLTSQSAGGIGEKQFQKSMIVGGTKILNGELPDNLLEKLNFTGLKIEKNAAKKLNQLNELFKKQFGYNMPISDGYRTFNVQNKIFDWEYFNTGINPITKSNDGKGKGRKKGSFSNSKKTGVSASKPGTSLHGWGQAIDISGFGNGPGNKYYDWMVVNAPKFGWINPDWAKKPGAGYEPWHWEYQGKDLFKSDSIA